MASPNPRQRLHLDNADISTYSELLTWLISVRERRPPHDTLNVAITPFMLSHLSETVDKIHNYKVSLREWMNKQELRDDNEELQIVLLSTETAIEAEYIGVKGWLKWIEALAEMQLWLSSGVNTEIAAGLHQSRSGSLPPSPPLALPNITTPRPRTPIAPPANTPVSSSPPRSDIVEVGSLQSGRNARNLKKRIPWIYLSGYFSRSHPGSVEEEDYPPSLTGSVTEITTESTTPPERLFAELQKDAEWIRENEERDYFIQERQRYHSHSTSQATIDGIIDDLRQERSKAKGKEKAPGSPQDESESKSTSYIHIPIPTPFRLAVHSGGAVTFSPPTSIYHFPAGATRSDVLSLLHRRHSAEGRSDPSSSPLSKAKDSELSIFHVETEGMEWELKKAIVACWKEEVVSPDWRSFVGEMEGEFWEGLGQGDTWVVGRTSGLGLLEREENAGEEEDGEQAAQQEDKAADELAEQPTTPGDSDPHRVSLRGGAGEPDVIYEPDDIVFTDRSFGVKDPQKLCRGARRWYRELQCMFDELATARSKYTDLKREREEVEKVLNMARLEYELTRLFNDRDYGLEIEKTGNLAQEVDQIATAAIYFKVRFEGLLRSRKKLQGDYDKQRREVEKLRKKVTDLESAAARVQEVIGMLQCVVDLEKKQRVEQEGLGNIEDHPRAEVVEVHERQEEEDDERERLRRKAIKLELEKMRNDDVIAGLPYVLNLEQEERLQCEGHLVSPNAQPRDESDDFWDHFFPQMAKDDDSPEAHRERIRALELQMVKDQDLIRELRYMIDLEQEERIRQESLDYNSEGGSVVEENHERQKPEDEDEVEYMPKMRGGSDDGSEHVASGYQTPNENPPSPDFKEWKGLPVSRDPIGQTPSPYASPSSSTNANSSLSSATRFYFFPSVSILVLHSDPMHFFQWEHPFSLSEIRNFLQDRQARGVEDRPEFDIIREIFQARDAHGIPDPDVSDGKMVYVSMPSSTEEPQKDDIEWSMYERPDPHNHPNAYRGRMMDGNADLIDEINTLRWSRGLPDLDTALMDQYSDGVDEEEPRFKSPGYLINNLSGDFDPANEHVCRCAADGGACHGHRARPQYSGRSFENNTGLSRKVVGAARGTRGYLDPAFDIRGHSKILSENEEDDEDEKLSSSGSRIEAFNYMGMSHHRAGTPVSSFYGNYRRPFVEDARSDSNFSFSLDGANDSSMQSQSRHHPGCESWTGIGYVDAEGIDRCAKCNIPFTEREFPASPPAGAPERTDPPVSPVSPQRSPFSPCCSVETSGTLPALREMRESYPFKVCTNPYSVPPVRKLEEVEREFVGCGRRGTCGAGFGGGNRKERGTDKNVDKDEAPEYRDAKSPPLMFPAPGEYITGGGPDWFHHAPPGSRDASPKNTCVPRVRSENASEDNESSSECSDCMREAASAQKGHPAITPDPIEVWNVFHESVNELDDEDYEEAGYKLIRTPSVSSSSSLRPEDSVEYRTRVSPKQFAAKSVGRKLSRYFKDLGRLARLCKANELRSPLKRCSYSGRMFKYCDKMLELLAFWIVETDRLIELWERIPGSADELRNIEKKIQECNLKRAAGLWASDGLWPPADAQEEKDEPSDPPTEFEQPMPDEEAMEREYESLDALFDSYFRVCLMPEHTRSSQLEQWHRLAARKAEYLKINPTNVNRELDALLKRQKDIQTKLHYLKQYAAVRVNYDEFLDLFSSYKEVATKFFKRDLCDLWDWFWDEMGMEDSDDGNSEDGSSLCDCKGCREERYAEQLRMARSEDSEDESSLCDCEGCQEERDAEQLNMTRNKTPSPGPSKAPAWRKVFWRGPEGGIEVALPLTKGEHGADGEKIGDECGSDDMREETTSPVVRDADYYELYARPDEFPPSHM